MTVKIEVILEPWELHEAVSRYIEQKYNLVLEDSKIELVDEGSKVKLSGTLKIQNIL